MNNKKKKRKDNQKLDVSKSPQWRWTDHDNGQGSTSSLPSTSVAAAKLDTWFPSVRIELKDVNWSGIKCEVHIVLSPHELSYCLFLSTTSI